MGAAGVKSAAHARILTNACIVALHAKVKANDVRIVDGVIPHEANRVMSDACAAMTQVGRHPKPNPNSTGMTPPAYSRTATSLHPNLLT